MMIKRISVGNYKNLAYTTLDCSRLIALVSANNYGKSNLLEAIRFGLDFLTTSSKTRKNKMHWLKGIPLVPALAGKDFRFEIEFDEPSLGKYRYVRYGFRFSWYNDQGTGGKLTDETIDLRANESVKYSSYLKRNEGKYRSSKSTQAFRKLSLDDDTLAVDVIGLIEDVEISQAIRQIKSIGYRLCDSLELDDSFHPNPIEFDFGANVIFDNEDIPRLLSMLGNKRPDLYNLFIETIYDLFPEFNHIELQTLTLKAEKNDALHAVMVMANQNGEAAHQTEIPYHIKDELYRLVIDSIYLNQPISMEHMSTGTKRIFWLIANAVVSEYHKINFLGVDEIETSIHPRMIKNLLEALTEILGNTSMIVTSHSPYLIQYLKPEAIYIGIPNEDGTACFKRIHSKKTKALLNAARKLEMTVGEYLFDLMSGDSDSAKILSSYLEDS